MLCSGTSVDPAGAPKDRKLEKVSVYAFSLNSNPLCLYQAFRRALTSGSKRKAKGRLRGTALPSSGTVHSPVRFGA